jgi:GNAT superfamily N-acetyltransferase
MNDSPAIRVTTWSLEQTAPAASADARAAFPPGVRVERAEIVSPELSRFLYTAVGGDIAWTDRLGWDHERWLAFLDRPGVETWVAYQRGTPAGYVELEAQDEGAVEITYFGLLPAFRGRGIGGPLLTFGTARAWDLADRWPGRTATRRVWVHTCSLDGPYALANYEKRGFTVFDVTVAEEPARQAPGPWPGAWPDPAPDAGDPE